MKITLVLFFTLSLFAIGCAETAAPHRSLADWETDMEYSAHDGKYYHKRPPPSVHDVIARDFGGD